MLSPSARRLVLNRRIVDVLPLLQRNPRDWRELEVTAMLFLEYQGCSAARGVDLEGIRGKHRVDVLGTFSLKGMEYKTIVECKYWSQKVRKEQVATLVSIMEDVGASKGIIISKSGFQTGAVNYAKKRSVELLTLQEVMHTIRRESIPILFYDLLDNLTELEGEIEDRMSSDRYMERELESLLREVRQAEAQAREYHYGPFLSRLKELKKAVEEIQGIFPITHLPSIYIQYLPRKKTRKKVGSWSDFLSYLAQDLNSLREEYLRLRKDIRQHPRYVV